MPFVYVIQGFDQGVREDIECSVFRIGRDSSNQLQLRDSEVSRHHAEIRLADGDVTVHDLGSSNGTFVNGCLLYTSPSPRDGLLSRMPSSA